METIMDLYYKENKAYLVLCLILLVDLIVGMQFPVELVLTKANDSKFSTNMFPWICGQHMMLDFL